MEVEAASPTIVATPEELGRMADPLPSEFAPSSLRRHALVVVAILAAIAAVVVLTPGLREVRDSLSGARSGWLVAAAVLQLRSCLSYVIASRAVFCRHMSWRTSYEIGTSELAANSLLSVGGAGGLALGAWIPRRGGNPPGRIARRTVAFFLRGGRVVRARRSPARMQPRTPGRRAADRRGRPACARRARPYPRVGSLAAEHAGA